MRKGDSSRAWRIGLVPRRSDRLRRARRRLAAGLPVTVKVNDDALEGTVAAVLPTIQNGAITLQVALKDPSSPLLIQPARRRGHRHGPRAARRAHPPRAVRPGEGAQQVFVIRGDRAVRTPVELGLASFDHFEVLRGLSPATRP